MYTYIYESIIGNLRILEEEDKIVRINFMNQNGTDVNEKNTVYSSFAIVRETELIKECGRQLIEYFKGRRQHFDIPIKAAGTEFQEKVWHALQRIPYGETRSYKQIAEQIGNSKASRAVGMANNRNPIPVIIPCHRVIGANGGMTGYGGGLNIKEKLLSLEQLNIEQINRR